MTTNTALASKESAPSSASGTLAAVPAESVASQLVTLPARIPFSISWNGEMGSLPFVTNNVTGTSAIEITAGYSGELVFSTAGSQVPLQFVPGVAFANSLPPTGTFTPPAEWPTTVTIPWQNNLPAGSLPQFFSYSLTVVTADGQIFTIDPTVENDPPTT